MDGVYSEEERPSCSTEGVRCYREGDADKEIRGGRETDKGYDEDK